MTKQSGAQTAPTASDKIEEFAEDLGRIIGTARAKADTWLGQRQKITNTLVSIRDEASRLLRELGQGAEHVGKRVPPPEVRTQAPRAAKRRPGRRQWSAAQRAAAADRMRKYWAARKKKA